MSSKIVLRCQCGARLQPVPRSASQMKRRCPNCRALWSVTIALVQSSPSAPQRVEATLSKLADGNGARPVEVRK